LATNNQAPVGQSTGAAQASARRAANLCLVTRVFALAIVLVLAPLGTPAMARYVDAHLDVPYLRDCHGLMRHLDECAITAQGEEG
jgi:hypothetical protein